MNHHSNQQLKVLTDQLELGMYVAALDKDWLDSPFLYQGFLIETHEDIQLLEQECQYVWVDPVKTPTPDEPLLTFKPEKQSKTRYINKLSMIEEHERSKQVFTTARQRTKTIMDDVTLNGVIDGKQAKQIVNNCLGSILNNPDALLWMSKIREANHYTSEHCLNVCILAIAFGRHLGMDEEELFNLGMCGLLHDVGKLRIPSEVLNKSTPLTTKEWKQMQAHVSIGRKLLMSSMNLSYTVDVAYNHHERIDGKGYPNQLTGDKLSTHTKIISIVDSFDAMTAERCYSKAKTASAAIREVYRGRGTQFDHRLALEFIKLVGLYPPGTIVELNNGYVGIVLERSQQYQQLPKVMLLKDEKNQTIKKRLVNLELVEQDKLPKDYLIKQDHPNGFKGINISDHQDFIQTLH